MTEHSAHPIYDDPELFETVLEACEALRANNLTAARKFANQATEDRPGSAESFFLLGVVAFLDDDVSRALPLFELAHDIDQDTADYAEALANLNARIGKLADSSYFAKLASTLTPHPAFQGSLLRGLQDYWQALGAARDINFIDSAICAMDEGRYEDAANELEKQRTINKDSVETAFLTARALAPLGEMDGAIAALQAALFQETANPRLHAAMADLMTARNDFAMARASATAALRHATTEDDMELALGSADSLAAADPGWTDWPSIVAEWHAGTPAASAAADGHGGLKVGILTDIAGDTQLGPFLFPLMRTRLDTAEILIYSTTGLNDETTQVMRRTGVTWVDLVDIDTETAAMLIEADAPDVLIDMTVTWQGRRPGLFRAAPAPHKVRWLGLDTALNSDLLTHALDDGILMPKDAGQPWAAQPIALGGPALAMLPPQDEVTATDAPMIGAGTVTLGAIADPAYLTPQTADLIAAVLHRIPGASLVLGGLPRPMDIKRLLEPFGCLGVLNRVHLVSGEDDAAAPTGAEFFRHLDLLFDPAPRSRPRDVAEALWQGVPVVSLAGATRQSRLGASVLAAAGQERWIADNAADYVDRAVDAVRWAGSTSGARQALHQAVKASDLFEPGAMAYRIEAALAATVRQ